MDDLAQNLAAMLNNPGTMQQVQSLLQNMGIGNTNQAGSPAAETPAASAPAPTTAAPEASPAAPAVNPLNALAGLGGSGLNAETLGLVTKLAPMLSAVHQENDSTRLLHALRPLLGQERQKKLDEAVRLLQLLHVLPLLRQNGLLGNLL